MATKWENHSGMRWNYKKDFSQMYTHSPYYIHSQFEYRTNEDPAYTTYVLPTTKPLQIMNNKFKKIVQLPKWTLNDTITNFNEETFYSELVDNFVKQYLTGTDKAFSDATNAINQLVALKPYLSEKLSQGLKVANQQAINKINNVLSVINRVYNIFSSNQNAQTNSRIFYQVLNNYLEAASFPQGSVGKYLKTMQSQVKNIVSQQEEIIDWSTLEKERLLAKNIIENLIIINNQNDLNKNNIMGILNNYIGKDIGEENARINIEHLQQKVLQDIDNQLITWNQHTGNTKVEKIGTLQDYNLKAPMTRADVMFGFLGNIEVEMSNNVVRIYEIQGGANVKNYQSNYSNKTDSWILKEYSGGKKQKLRYVSVLNESPLIRYVNEVAYGSTRNIRRTINAYVHQSSQMDEDIKGIVEQVAFVSGVQGTGRTISNVNSRKMIDVNMIFVINGYVYSVVDIVNSIVKQDKMKSVQISYSKVGQGWSKVKSSNNWIKPNEIRNANSAYIRSKIAYKKFKDILISVGISASYFNSIRTKAIAKL